MLNLKKIILEYLIILLCPALYADSCANFFGTKHCIFVAKDFTLSVVTADCLCFLWLSYVIAGVWRLEKVNIKSANTKLSIFILKPWTGEDQNEKVYCQH